MTQHLGAMGDNRIGMQNTISSLHKLETIDKRPHYKDDIKIGTISYIQCKNCGLIGRKYNDQI